MLQRHASFKFTFPLVAHVLHAPSTCGSAHSPLLGALHQLRDWKLGCSTHGACAGINYLADLHTGLQRMLGWLQPGGLLVFNTPQARQ